MKLAKLDAKGLIDIRFCTPQMGAKITELRNNGFLDFVSSEQPQVESGYIAIDSFEIITGKLVQSWNVKVDPKEVEMRIGDLKAQLASTDYVVTKCMEASLIGEVMPYDIQKVHSERQAIRDKINELEKSI